MKKRVLSALLAPMLLFAMAAPGMAAEGGDSARRLATVTERVKSTLGLDTQRYKNFSGQLTEGELAPTWRLSWSGEDGSLEITAAESGKILSYYLYSDDENRDDAPLSLPKRDPARAKAAAAAFLGKVLDSYESVDLEDAADQSVSLRQTRYYFRGTVKLNGCPSPLSFSLAVRSSDYAVAQFRRDSMESGYLGSLPAADFRTSQSQAEPLLRSTLSMRLEYVLEDEGNRAVLRYLPNSIHNFYVDDASGTLVDLTELYEGLGESDRKGSESMAPETGADASAGGNGLTQAERLGADKLKGTLSKEALDQKARAVTQLGLDSYTLASASYREEELEPDAPAIIAQLSYAKRVEDGTFRRIVTLDAKTGGLLRVYSSRPQAPDEENKVSEDAARKTAEAFLSAQQKSRFAQCAAYAGDLGDQRENGRYGAWRFQYARQEQGYFFPHDQFTVEIDAADGSVSSYAQSWSKNVRFDSARGIISEEQAFGAYYKMFRLVKGYVAVPQKLDLSDPEHAPLAEMGYRALNSLKLGWQLSATERSALGIDAKTGQPVLREESSGGTLTYSDLEGSQAKQAVEALAEYGIGYAGGRFRPEKQLTQLDLAALLASTQGLVIDPDNLAEGDADRVYRAVYGMGALRREDRNDGKVLSRLDVIRCLLDAGGYGPAARLQGIYRTDFSDAGDIPDGLLGYAALAQALKLADGGRLNPGQSAARADAALMLFAFMERN
ncbi:MAG: S-layer homology domain-containing protein [Lawsonibacter sp.]|jgi:hypothetical protein|nr:S-layer homology domain-containing protein [Lawsonibacter sp.]